MKSMRREKTGLEKTGIEETKSIEMRTKEIRIKEMSTKEMPSTKMSSGNAYEEVIRRNSATVYRFAYSLVRTRSDADDIYQEVFLRYVRKTPVFDNVEHERAWFMRVTINCCKNFWKSPWVQRRDAFEKDAFGEDAEGQNEQAYGTDCMHGEENWQLIETVRQLPEKYRAVIHLFYYEELSVEEIAEITQSKASTVRTRLTRARRSLKRLLDEKGEDFHV